MFVSRGRVFFMLLVVVSSSLALPIDIGPGEHDRRNDFGLSYGKLKKSIGEALKKSEKRNSFEEYDDYDLKHYLDQNLDYGLLERLTNEILEENGGDLDRELTDDEYGEISEEYFKSLEGRHTSENANSWKTLPITGHGSNKVSTSWATPTRDNTPHQNAHTTPAPYTAEWRTTPPYWWTSPTYWDGTVFGWKTAWQTWKQTTARGTDSWQTHKHTKHFDWTGESKSGHQVHVVVYFDK